MSIWHKIVLCSYQILFKRPLIFNQIFSQTLDERSQELNMQYIICITFANTVNTVNQKQKGCLRIIRVAIDRYETFTNECNLYIFHFFFLVIIVYSGAQDVCALMMKHGLTPDGKMWVYFNPFPPKSEEKWFLFKLTYTYWYLFLVSVNTKFSQLKFTYALELSQPTKWGILLFCTIAMMKIAKWIQGSQLWPMSTLNFHSLNSLMP